MCTYDDLLSQADLSVGDETPPEAMILMQCAPFLSSSLAARLTCKKIQQQNMKQAPTRIKCGVCTLREMLPAPAVLVIAIKHE